MKQETAMKRYPRHRWFEWYNANPKGIITGDCTTRALSVALNVSYQEAFEMQCEMMKKTGFFVSSDNCTHAILEENGFRKLKQPRYWDNKKVNFIELFQMIDQSETQHLKNGDLYKDLSNARIFANAGARHVVGIKNLKVYDVWDSSWQKVGIMYAK